MNALQLSRRTAQVSPKAITLRISGDVDAVSEEKVRAYFDEALQADQARHVLLDLSGLTFAGTGFLSCLLLWREELARQKGVLVLFSLRREFASTLRIVALDRLLTVRPDEASALAALPKE